jgi:multiple sugar transport system substrate-binding protein
MKHTLTAILLTGLFAFSCGGARDGVELQLWNFGGLPRMMEWSRTRADSFSITHPGIRVIHSQKSWNMIRELLYTNLSAGTGPDVMNVHANYAAEFGGAGFYYPISKFPDFEEVKSWFEPHLFESTRYGDDYYGLPSSAIAFTLVCNKEMFDRAGISPPRTWSEFRRAAKLLTRDTDGDGTTDQWGLVLLGGDRGGFAYRFAPFLFKAGMNILSEDLTRVEFNGPMGVRALQLFVDMHQIDHSITPGFLAYQHSEINDLFCSNKVAMSIEGPWFRPLVDQKSPGKPFYTVPVPVPDHLVDQYDTMPTLQDMVMYAISAHSTHPNEAWELVKYFRTPEADMYWIREELGAVATTREALNSPEAAAKEFLPVYRHELAHARPWPPHPGIISIARNVITPWCQKAIVGEISAKEAMRAAGAEAQKILDGEQ